MLNLNQTPFKTSNWRSADRLTLIGIGIVTLAAIGPGLGAESRGIDPEAIAVSPDITVKYFGEILTDQQASEPGAPSNRIDVGPLPAGVEMSGFHLEGSAILFAIDQRAELDGILVTPQDVALKEAGNAVELFFKGAGLGLPTNVKIDAVAWLDGELVVSFDTTISLAGDAVADEDLVVVTGGGSPAIVFDGSAKGVNPALDLNAAHFIDSDILAMSFDGTGKLNGFIFDDEDVVVLDGDWAPLYDGSAVDSGWLGGDLKGVSIAVSSPPIGLIFEDGFESGNTTAWSSSLP